MKGVLGIRTARVAARSPGPCGKRTQGFLGVWYGTSFWNGFQVVW